MGIEIRVPSLPESVTEAAVGEWHKKPGDRVQRDEAVLELETDKVVLDVPAPGQGILQEIKKEKDAAVSSEEVLGIIEPVEAGSEPPPAKPDESPERPPEEAQEAAAGQESAAEAPAAPAHEAETTPPLSPAVRRLLTEYRLNSRDIPASGKDGRLTRADVMRFLETKEQGPAPSQPAPEPALAPAEPSPGEAGGVRRERMSRLRQRVAERMLDAQQATAALTTFNEVNMQGVMDLRRRYREAFEKRYGVRLGFMSFFIKACVDALKRYPIVNAAIEDKDILYFLYYHIGIAVATQRGLVVPVIRHADRIGFADMEAQIGDFAQRARSGQLALEELTGGTFTLTNGGIFGSLLSTPLLNPPQSAILGMHKIEDRPIVEQGEVRIRPMMYVALTYDHRLIDGREAVRFLVGVKEAIEDPARLLLEV